MDDTGSTGAHYRVRIFVDFWNFTLLMRDVDSDFSTDWSKLGPVLTRAAIEAINSSVEGEYQGLNFYGSYNPATDKGKKRHRWARDVVSRFPGVKVSMEPRQKEFSPPKCPTCYHEVSICPRQDCRSDMRGTEEKGVDVRMAIDMVRFALADNYNVAVLVSSDQDFVPVAEFLETQGIKVIHGSFPPKGAQLTKSCWSNINLPSIREDFRFHKQ